MRYRITSDLGVPLRAHEWIHADLISGVWLVEGEIVEGEPVDAGASGLWIKVRKGKRARGYIHSSKAEPVKE